MFARFAAMMDWRKRLGRKAHLLMKYVPLVALSSDMKILQRHMLCEYCGGRC